MESAIEWLRGRAGEMEALLRELVEISSHTPDSFGNDRVASRLVEAAHALTKGALEGGVRRGASGKYGAHLRLRSRASGPRVLLVGHHDTVFPVEKFAGFHEDGALLRGPGVLDMKGGLVVCAFALGALAEAGALDRVAVELLSVSDEEVGSPEGRVFVEESAREARCALVYESGRQGDLIITRRKGTGGLRVTVEGKAAHAGNAHGDGVNAIWALAKFVDAAQQLTDYPRGVTVNVGKIEGGIGKNTVADRAEALVDLRFVAAHDGGALVRALTQAAEDAAQAVPGARATVEGGILRRPLERTDASAELAARFGACQRAAGLGDGEAPLLGGGSDANTVAALGVPAICGLGPRGRGFHTLDEHIERATLVPKAEALVRFLLS